MNKRNVGFALTLLATLLTPGAAWASDGLPVGLFKIVGNFLMEQFVPEIWHWAFGLIIVALTVILLTSFQKLHGLLTALFAPVVFYTVVRFFFLNFTALVELVFNALPLAYKALAVVILIGAAIFMGMALVVLLKGWLWASLMWFLKQIPKIWQGAKAQAAAEKPKPALKYVSAVMVASVLVSPSLWSGFTGQGTPSFIAPCLIALASLYVVYRRWIAKNWPYLVPSAVPPGTPPHLPPDPHHPPAPHPVTPGHTPSPAPAPAPPPAPTVAVPPLTKCNACGQMEVDDKWCGACGKEQVVVATPSPQKKKGYGNM